MLGRLGLSWATLLAWKIPGLAGQAVLAAMQVWHCPGGTLSWPGRLRRAILRRAGGLGVVDLAGGIRVYTKFVYLNKFPGPAGQAWLVLLAVQFGRFAGLVAWLFPLQSGLPATGLAGFWLALAAWLWGWLCYFAQNLFL